MYQPSAWFHCVDHSYISFGHNNLDFCFYVFLSVYWDSNYSSDEMNEITIKGHEIWSYMAAIFVVLLFNLTYLAQFSP